MKTRTKAEKTAHVALVEKRICVELGYYDDEFIDYFVDPATQSPILSLMHYIRTVSIRKVADLFIESFNGQPVQFVNLGCGLDTICFYLLKKHPNVTCFDTDLESQLKLKCELMSGHKIFTDLIPDLKLENGFYTSARYKVIPLDLCHIEDFQRLLDAGLSKDLPTLFFAECVFMYIDPDVLNETLKYISNFCNGPVCCLEYGLVGQEGYFAKSFVQKYKEHSLTISSFQRYKTLEENIQRYKDSGWEWAYAATATTFWNLLPESERKRVLAIQSFNEIEGLGVHYGYGMCCVASNRYDHQAVYKHIFTDTPDTNKESELYLKDIDYYLKITSPSFNKEFDKFFSQLWDQRS